MLMSAWQVKAAHAAAVHELQGLGEDVRDEAAMAVQINKWMTQLYSTMSAVEESRLDKVDSLTADTASLELNGKIEAAAERCFSQVCPTGV